MLKPSRPAIALTAFAAAMIGSSAVVAQMQSQGMTVGSPGIAGGAMPAGPKPSKPVTRASCMKSGKESGLRGSKLQAYVKSCMKP